jgi:hypothetical protein
VRLCAGRECSPRRMRAPALAHASRSPAYACAPRVSNRSAPCLPSPPPPFPPRPSARRRARPRSGSRAGLPAARSRTAPY